MLKQRHPYRFIAAFLVLLISFSSLGLTVQVHYCMGRVKSVSLIGEAKACYPPAKTKVCHTKKDAPPLEKAQKQRRGCCDDQLILMDADLDLIPSQSLDLSPVDQYFLWALAWSTLPTLKSYSSPVPYQNYKPPLLDQDICVLVQSFLL